MVAREHGIQYAPVYFKSLEIQRDLKLKKRKGDFDREICISEDRFGLYNGGLTIKIPPLSRFSYLHRI